MFLATQEVPIDFRAYSTRAARRHLGAPRFRALYRARHERGDRVVLATTSPVTADAIARGDARLECPVAAHQYLHLSLLAGTA